MLRIRIIQKDIDKNEELKEKIQELESKLKSNKYLFLLIK